MPAPVYYREWSLEDIARARALWDEGLTGADIARELGCSKNSLIGLAHRNKFAPRASPIRHASPNEPFGRADPAQTGPPPRRLHRRRHHPRADAPPVPPPQVPRPPQLPPPPLREPLGSLGLGALTCQWASGDERPYTWCGAVRLPGRAYCPDHCARAYRATGPVHV